MSSPELRNINGNAGEPRPAGRVSADRQKRFDTSTVSERIEVLSSRFDSLRLIGGYGNATFYLARDRRANTQDGMVKLKVFSGHAESDSRQLELFRLEARAAAKLSHRNIIETSLPEEIQGVHFSVIEHRAEAMSLKDLLDREAWLDPKVAVEIIHQIADALEYADSLGVLHLRIQPESILLDSDGTARLTDFGLEARGELSWAHRERSRHCAAHYISPEQVSSRSVDSRSDLYSLGILLYKMLTDRLPFDSENLSAVRQKHLTHTPLPPHLYGVDFPLWMSAVITRLLEKDPAKRFQDVASFRLALDRSASSRTIVLQGDDPAEGEEAAHKEERAAFAIDTPAAQASNSETWELPSITLRNAPVDEVSSVEPQIAKEPANEFLQSDTGEQVNTGPFSFENSAEPLAVTRARKKEWRIWAVIVALALTLVGGLIALVRADRAQSLLQTQSESPAPEEQSETNAAAPVEPATNGTGDRLPIGNRQPVTNPKLLESGRPGTARPGGVGRTRSASSRARTTRQRTVQSSPSRRYYPAKRRWLRVRRPGRSH